MWTQTGLSSAMLFLKDTGKDKDGKAVAEAAVVAAATAGPAAATPDAAHADASTSPADCPSPPEGPATKRETPREELDTAQKEQEWQVVKGKKKKPHSGSDATSSADGPGGARNREASGK